MPYLQDDHKDDYYQYAYYDYDIDELCSWAHLLIKRATHRKNPDKMKKDIYDAKNYLDMLEEALETEIEECEE